MKNLFLAAIVITAMALPGCGSGGNVACSDRGMCPQDTVPTAAYVNVCQTMLGSICGSQWQAVLNCVKANEQCDSIGNMDLSATQAVCSTQFSNFATCCTANPAAVGCPTSAAL